MGKFLTTAQVLLIVTLMALGWREVLEKIWPVLLIVVGAALGVSAIGAIRMSHVKMTPEPARDAELCTRGPYRWIRHPMYAAALLYAGAFALSWPGLVLWLALVIVLIAKLKYEERHWLRHDSRYADYMDRTKRLIPGIW